MRRQRSILATMATVVTCSLAMPGLASAAPPPDATVRLEVDVSALPKDRLAEDTRTWVLKHQTTAFQEAGFTVSEDASRVVRTEISRYGEYGVNTKARLIVVGDEGLIRELTCEACRDSQFLDKVGQETAALAEQLREIEASREPVVEPEPTIEQPPEAATQDEGTEPARGEAPTDHDGAPLGAAGYAGIGALAVGAGMTLGGAIVLLQGESSTLHPDRDRQLEVTDRAPLGAGLTSVGIGLLVTGAVLVTLDHTVLRKRRSSRAQASVVVPVVAPTGLGLSWAARF